MPRLTHVLKLLLVNGLVLAACVVVIELLFGGWINEKRLNHLNLLKDCTLKFDVSHLYHDADPTVRYTRDKYGLRGDFGDPATIDILTVGGSTTDQRYIRDGDTWQNVLQGRFKSAGLDVAVANAGVDGQSTYGHIKNFEWWFPHIPGLQPSYVLFYVGLNDFHKEVGYSFDALEIEGSSVKNQIKKKSAVWHLVRTARGVFQAMVVKKIGHRAIDFSAEEYTDRPLLDDYAFMDARLDEYASRLRALASMTAKLGATPVFVTQPSRRYRITPAGIEGEAWVDSYDGRKFNGVDYYAMIRRLDGVTRSVSEEQRAIFIDLAAYEGWQDADFYDTEHMTPQGARKVGELLYEGLKDVVSVTARQVSGN